MTADNRARATPEYLPYQSNQTESCAVSRVIALTSTTNWEGPVPSAGFYSYTLPGTRVPTVQKRCCLIHTQVDTRVRLECILYYSRLRLAISY